MTITRSPVLRTDTVVQGLKFGPARLQNPVQQRIVVFVIEVEVESVEVSEVGKSGRFQLEVHVLEHKVQTDPLKPRTVVRDSQLVRFGIEEPEVLDVERLGTSYLCQVLLKVGRIKALIASKTFLYQLEHLLPRPEERQVGVAVCGAVIHPLQVRTAFQDFETADVTDLSTLNIQNPQVLTS